MMKIAVIIIVLILIVIGQFIILKERYEYEEHRRKGDQDADQAGLH